MSLVIATVASVAGMANRRPPAGSGITSRGGACTAGSRSSAAMASASAG